MSSNDELVQKLRDLGITDRTARFALSVRHAAGTSLPLCRPRLAILADPCTKPDEPGDPASGIEDGH